MAEDLPWQIDYREVALRSLNGSATDGPGFGAAITERWCDQYQSTTSWFPEIVEITLDSLIYLFDLAPSHLGSDVAQAADDRVVGVWGRAAAPPASRDTSRQRGFVPNPPAWSGAGYDRGHFVAHSLGGGMDLNFFPQARGLNRGHTTEGRRWRAMERRAAQNAGTLLFVRPIYTDASWIPTWLEFGITVGATLEVETFDNRPPAQAQHHPGSPNRRQSADVPRSLT